MKEEIRKICKFCSRENCYRHCQKSKDGKHEPDPASIAPAECNAETGQMLVDIWCKHCGISGSVGIEPGDIAWE